MAQDHRMVPWEHLNSKMAQVKAMKNRMAQIMAQMMTQDSKMAESPNCIPAKQINKERDACQASLSLLME
jgi:hypothetical protein